MSELLLCMHTTLSDRWSSGLLVKQELLHVLVCRYYHALHHSTAQCASFCTLPLHTLVRGNHTHMLLLQLRCRQYCCTDFVDTCRAVICFVLGAVEVCVNCWYLCKAGLGDDHVVHI
jgi:hypothetical protein